MKADTGQALWLSSDQHLDEWTHQFFPASSEQGPFQALAPVVALAATDGQAQERQHERRRVPLLVQVASPRYAENTRVQVEVQGEIVAATVDGRPFDLSAFSQSARHGS